MWDTFFLYGLVSLIGKFFKKRDEKKYNDWVASVDKEIEKLTNKQLEEEVWLFMQDKNNYEELRGIIKPIYDSLPRPINFDTQCIYWEDANRYRGEKRTMMMDSWSRNRDRIIFILMVRKGYLPRTVAVSGYRVYRNDYNNRAILEYGRRELFKNRNDINEEFLLSPDFNEGRYEDGLPGTLYFSRV